MPPSTASTSSSSGHLTWVSPLHPLPSPYLHRATHAADKKIKANNIGHPILDGVIAQEVKDALAKILAASHKAGKKCGIFSTGGEQAQQFAAQGFDLISVATDYTALEFTLKESLSVAKGTAKPAKGGSY